MDFRKLFLWIFLLGWPAFDGQQAAVAQDAAFVGESRAIYSYGQSVRFMLQGETAVPFSQASLSFQAVEFAAPFTVDFADITDETIALEYQFDLSGDNRLLPFTTVTYWWDLVDENGNVFHVPARTFYYEDTQFVWESAADELVTVYWRGGNVQLGRAALAIVQESQQRISQLLPAAEEEPIQVYIYPSSADLRASLRLNGVDWDEQYLAPALDVVLVTAVNPRTAVSDLQQSIPHELTRLRLARLTAPHADALPLWLLEGIAVRMEKRPNPTYESMLETAVSNQATMPFTDLCEQLPASVNGRMLATAQSADLIRYIQEQYGNQKIRDLVDAYAEGVDCTRGVENSLNLSLPTLNQNWLDTYQIRMPLLQFLIDNSIWFWLILGILVLMVLLIWKV